MFKKIFGLVFVSAFVSLSAYDQAHVDLVLNPYCKGVYALDLRAADLHHHCIECKTFVSVDFRGANLSWTQFAYCCFIDCIFVDSIVDNTDFQASTFIKCNLLKLVGTPKFPQSALDEVTERSLNGFEDAEAYASRSDRFGLGASCPVHGLCRQVADEANKAVGQ